MFFTPPNGQGQIPPELLEQILRAQQAQQTNGAGPAPGPQGYERIDPRTVILEGPDLVKEIPDNPNLPTVKVQRIFHGMNGSMMFQDVD